eukprot:1010239-Amphidinium_carterae.1
MHFELVHGTGPSSGWISTRSKGNALVSRCAPIIACFYGGGMKADQGRSSMKAFLNKVDEAGGSLHQSSHGLTDAAPAAPLQTYNMINSKSCAPGVFQVGVEFEQPQAGFRDVVVLDHPGGEGLEDFGTGLHESKLHPVDQRFKQIASHATICFHTGALGALWGERTAESSGYISRLEGKLDENPRHRGRTVMVVCFSHGCVAGSHNLFISIDAMHNPLKSWISLECLSPRKGVMATIEDSC